MKLLLIVVVVETLMCQIHHAIIWCMVWFTCIRLLLQSQLEGCKPFMYISFCLWKEEVGPFLSSSSPLTRWYSNSSQSVWGNIGRGTIVLIDLFLLLIFNVLLFKCVIFHTHVMWLWFLLHLCKKRKEERLVVLAASILKGKNRGKVA